MMPFSSITYVMRLENAAFSYPDAPYINVSLPSESHSSGNGNECFALKTRLSSAVSVLAPKTTMFRFSNSWILSRNPSPSDVQPGVDALGKNHKINFLPRYCFSVCLLPLSSGISKSGAEVPSARTCPLLPVTVCCTIWRTVRVNVHKFI